MVMPIIGSFFTKTGRMVDPFATFKFHVEMGNVIEASFTECSGLEMKTTPFPYKEGGLNEYTHQLPDRTEYTNITLKRGFTMSNELFNWYKEMEEKLLRGKRFDFRQVTIILYSTVELGIPMRWTLNKAFPVRWVGPMFKTDEAAVAVETLEFAHHGITVDMTGAVGMGVGLLGKLLSYI